MGIITLMDDDNLKQFRKDLWEGKKFIFKVLIRPDILEEFAEEKTGQKVEKIKFNGFDVLVKFSNGSIWGMNNYEMWEINEKEDFKDRADLLKELKETYEEKVKDRAIFDPEFTIETRLREAGLSVRDNYRDFFGGLGWVQDESIVAVERVNGEQVGKFRYTYDFNSEEDKKPKEHLEKSGTLKEYSPEDEDIKKIRNYLQSADIFLSEENINRSWNGGREAESVKKAVATIDGKEYILLDEYYTKNSDGERYEKKGLLTKLTEEQKFKMMAIEDYLTVMGYPPIATQALIKVGMAEKIETKNPEIEKLLNKIRNEINLVKMFREDEDVQRLMENLQGLTLKEVAKELGLEYGKDLPKFLEQMEMHGDTWWTSPTEKVFHLTTINDPWEMAGKIQQFYENNPNWEVRNYEENVEYRQGFEIEAKHKTLPIRLSVVEDGINVVVNVAELNRLKLQKEAEQSERKNKGLDLSL
jgi:hypothetical protein